MITIIKNVLNIAELKAINQLVEHGDFICGRETAGWHAKSVKNNQQWHAAEEIMSEVNTAISHKLIQKPEFSSAVYPKKIQPFIISESKDGGGYGAHIDDALMGSDQIYRTDISCTIFLSSLHDYEGGELLIGYDAEQRKIKLNAGDAVIYPSTTLHEVAPVTKGVRRVAVSWVESYIRDKSHREILYDLDIARKDIMKNSGKTAAFDLITKSHSNLLRKWADT